MIEDPQVPAEPSVSSPVKQRVRKRRRTATKGQITDLTAEDDSQPISPKEKKTKGSSPSKTKEEKRLKRFRHQAPATYLERLHRATTQRMFVIDRSRNGTGDAPQETITIAGTTGNIYHVNIDHVPSCTCPDNQKNNQCKHIVYVLHNVLKAPEHLQYQLAFLSSELQEIFSTAPALPSSQAEAAGDSPSNRKEVSGDCPICFTEFSPTTDEIVWCKAACGNNIHKDCFEQWAKSQSGKVIRCVYCRQQWQGDEDSIKRIVGSGKVNAEGYVNVAGELGLSGAKDYSSYHQPWARRQGLGYY